jgi:DNA-directed DNA polymerase III PolC
MLLASHTYFSLRYGVLPPDQLVRAAARAGHSVVALTDINNTTGMPDFVGACRKYGVHPIAGIEFRVGDRVLYTGIAQNTQGFQELNTFLSYHNINQIRLPDRAPTLDNCLWFYSMQSFPKQHIDNEWIGLRLADRSLLVRASKQTLDRCVIQQPLTFTTELGYQFHRHLRAIDHNTLLSKVGDSMTASPFDVLHTPLALKTAFEQWPQVYANTQRILLQCGFDFDLKSPKNRKTYTGSVPDDHSLLRKLAWDGFATRYGSGSKYARDRTEKELETICNLGFAAYFLITYDIIKYSLSHGIYHVGRGSGANSIVAYCLRITDVDPVELDLYFERFINPKRSSPPDFDIDYSWRDRDQVTDYIFKRFGSRHTALLGAMSTFQTNAAVRELSKVYGLPKEETDLLLERPNDPKNKNPIVTKVLTLARLMTDFPNLRTIHAGGILISEQPIFAYTALDMPPKGFPTTQWDMYVAESIGFEKLDILSQRGIGHINESVQIIKKTRNEEVDAHNVVKFKTDPKTVDLLYSGETIGCFYIESPAMRGLLKKLRCRDYITLVAASSIIRPGVAQSGMMGEYIKRFHNPKGFKYLHPIIEQQLAETYGIMVYQEDVLKVCHHFAGLDLADADVLRRIMSGKHRKKDDIERITKRFFDNCRQRGYPDDIVNELWRQIASFAGYSFSKAHSASYAVESFQSLYLKAHYPLEFIVAVINNFGGFYRTWVYIHEARRLGAEIELPCVNNSFHYATLHGKHVFLGFILVESLKQETVKQLVDERNRNGLFKSLADFVSRTGTSLLQLRILIRVGAFRFTGKSKSTLLWEAHMLCGKTQPQQATPRLFETEEPRFDIPATQESPTELAYDEIELLGFPVTVSYFDMLQTKFRGSVNALNIMEHAGKIVKLTALLVDIKYVWTKKRELMHFGNFIDTTGRFIDTVHFPDTLKTYPFTGPGVYLIEGKVTVEFGHPSIEVHKMARLPLLPDPRNEKQRHSCVG